MSGLEQNKLSLLSVTFVEIEAIFQNKFKMAYIYIFFFFLQLQVNQWLTWLETAEEEESEDEEY